MASIRKITNRILLVLSIFLIICGLCLTGVSVCSSAWQIVDLRELRVYHEHGVWWDCLRQDGLRSYSSRIITKGRSQGPEMKCSHKFDLAAQKALDSAIEEGDASAKELQLHRLLPQHKAVMFFAFLTTVFGLLGVAVGVLAACFKLCIIVYGVLLFLSASCSLLADAIFVLAASRISVRYVPGIVDMHEQRLGSGLFVHIIASATFLLAFLIVSVSGCLLIAPKRTHKRRNGDSEYYHYQSPQLRSYQKRHLETVLEMQSESAGNTLVDGRTDNASTVSLL